jgi:hypothetical protein
MAITRGTLNKAYVSAIDMLDQRDINPALIDAANDTGFLKTMQLLGRTKKCKMTEYHHFVNSDLFVATTVGTTTGSGTAQVTTALTAGNGFWRVGDVAKFPNGKDGVVYSVSTTSGVDTLVINSGDGTNLTLVSGNALVYNGNVVGEESSAVTNRKYDVTKYSNLIQAFREIDVITDIQKVTPIEFTYNGQNLYGVYEHAKKVQTLKASVDIAMIGGQISTTKYGDASPALVDANGKPIQKTRGLDQYATTYGIADDLATAGTLVTADLVDFASKLNAAKAPLEYMGYCSDASKIVYDTYFKALGSSGIQSGRMSIDGKDIDLTVDSYTFGSRKYTLIPLPIFDHPQLFTASIKKSIYWIPTGKVNCEGSGMQPRIQIRYLQHSFPGGNEMIGEWHTGALSPNGNGEDANWKAHWETYQGLEILGANQIAKQSGVAA